VQLDRSRRSRRWRRIALLLAVSLGVPVFGSAGAAASERMRIAVPAYNGASGTWSRVAGTSEVALVVANPASGPGTALDSTYAELLATASRAGKRLLGYVHTDYARRPLSDVLADVERYRAWYGINGFFLDEVPWSCDDRSLSSYYAGVAAAIRSHESPFVVLNPGGTQQRDCYMPSADVVVNFEGTSASYASWHANAWTDAYDAGRFWHIVYSADDAARDRVVLTARQRNVGHLYVTSHHMPNPFADLPPVGYWNALLRVASGGAPVSGGAAPFPAPVEFGGSGVLVPPLPVVRTTTPVAPAPSPKVTRRRTRRVVTVVRKVPAPVTSSKRTIGTRPRSTARPTTR